MITLIAVSKVAHLRVELYTYSINESYFNLTSKTIVARDIFFVNVKANLCAIFDQQDVVNRIVPVNRVSGLSRHAIVNRVTIMNRTATIVSMAVVLLASLAVTSTAHAQSTGLKLGQEAPATKKLDLGAAPPASRTPQPTAAATGAAGNGIQTIGAWEVNCVAGADCAMAQIGKDSTSTPILEMVVRKLKTPLDADGRTAIAVVDFITPLGVVLTSGLELKIDGGQGEAAPFQICTEQGCLVREPVDQGLIDRLKKGNNASVGVVAANQGEVTALISLSGFTKAYDTLQ